MQPNKRTSDRTARRVFTFGASDHLPLRIVELPGKPFVAVPSPEELKPGPRPVMSTTTVLRRGSARAELYVRAALRNAADRIIDAGRRHPVILAEACGLARLVHAGLLSKTDLKSVVWQAAQQAGKEDEAEIDRIIDFGMDHADTAPLPRGIAHG